MQFASILVLPNKISKQFVLNIKNNSVLRINLEIINSCTIRTEENAFCKHSSDSHGISTADVFTGRLNDRFTGFIQSSIDPIISTGVCRLDQSLELQERPKMKSVPSTLNRGLLFFVLCAAHYLSTITLPTHYHTNNIRCLFAFQYNRFKYF